MSAYNYIGLGMLSFCYNTHKDMHHSFHCLHTDKNEEFLNLMNDTATHHSTVTVAKTGMLCIILILCVS